MPKIELRINPNGDVIDQLIDHVIILATESQNRFSERYGQYSWQVDLNEPARFWFEREPEPAEFRPHFIGSTSGTSNTWLWGWENINDFPEPIVALATELRDATSQSGSIELQTAQLPLLPEAREEQGLPPHDEYSYVLSAMALSGLDSPVFYRGPTGGGSFVWFVLDNPQEFTLPAPLPTTIASSISQALQAGRVQNHRLAIEKYAEQREGVRLLPVSDGLLRLSTAGGDLNVEFDAEGRITKMAGEAHPVEDAAVSQHEDAKPKGFLGRLFGKK